MLGGDSPMAATRNEMKDLMLEHQAIRAHMNFIIESFKSVSAPSSRVTAQLIQLNDLMRLYLWPLYDFRETIQRHIALDERVFNASSDSSKRKDLAGEHEEIRKQADKAIQLAEHAAYNKLNPEELNQSTLNIRKIFNRLCELIETHTAEEDRLLKLKLEPEDI
jgi:hypothetical protein